MSFLTIYICKLSQLETNSITGTCSGLLANSAQSIAHLPARILNSDPWRHVSHGAGALLHLLPRLGGAELQLR